jgi:tRNA nucleotidyltransferase/poly(A) polymerase
MGLTPSDYDIATTARPHEVIEQAAKMGWKSIPTGLSHGTVTVVNQKGHWEVTTLRIDEKTDGRRALVNFEGADFTQDAQRRDFTINAMFEDRNGVIYDFFDGRTDLSKKIIRFVGVPEERIKEDYLRILRLFRFSSKLGFSIDPLSMQAAVRFKDGLQTVSIERISEELWQIYRGKNALNIVNTLFENSFLPSVLNLFNLPPIAIQLRFEKERSSVDVKIQPWLVLTFLSLFKRTKETSDKILTMGLLLKWSQNKQKTFASLVTGWLKLEDQFLSRSNQMDFLDFLHSGDEKHNIENFYGPIWTCLATCFQDKTRLRLIKNLIEVDCQFFEMRVKPMPISGDDLMAEYPQLKGRDLGRVLTLLKEHYRDGHWSSKKEGLDFIKTMTLV